ncbi:MAG: hypothetical protein AVDCRST_MAG41-1227, partial [uncultured Corynebacteriales bacterium]
MSGPRDPRGGLPPEFDPRGGGDPRFRGPDPRGRDPYGP